MIKRLFMRIRRFFFGGTYKSYIKCGKNSKVTHIVHSKNFRSIDIKQEAGDGSECIQIIDID